MKFYVVREHLGDRMYQPGDTREAAESDVKHLIGSVLSREPSAAKSDAQRLNKAEVVPHNKSETAGDGETETDPLVEFEGLKKSDLLKLAEAEGVPVDNGMTKAGLIDAILAARAAKDA